VGPESAVTIGERFSDLDAIWNVPLQRKGVTSSPVMKAKLRQKEEGHQARVFGGSQRKHNRVTLQQGRFNYLLKASFGGGGGGGATLKGASVGKFGQKGKRN